MEAKSVINWIGVIVVTSIAGIVTLLALGRPIDQFLTVLAGFVGTALTNFFLALNIAQTRREVKEVKDKVSGSVSQ